MAQQRVCQLCTAEEAVLMLTIFDPGFVQLVGPNCIAAMAVGVTESQTGVRLVVTPEQLADMQAQADQVPVDGAIPSPAAEEGEGTGEVTADNVATPVPDPGPKSANGTSPAAEDDDWEESEAAEAAADG